MAKVLHEPETQNGQESELARFQRAMKTILTVPKGEIVGIQKKAKSNSNTPKLLERK